MAHLPGTTYYGMSALAFVLVGQGYNSSGQQTLALGGGGVSVVPADSPSSEPTSSLPSRARGRGGANPTTTTSSLSSSSLHRNNSISYRNTSFRATGPLNPSRKASYRETPRDP
eukprot:jgi/Psemu1/306142/fgenesh1_kg.237_\